MGTLSRSIANLEERLKWSVLFAIVLAVLTAIRELAVMREMGENGPVEWLQILASQMTLFLYWGLVAPVILFAMEWARDHGLNWPRTVGVHVLVYVVLGSVFVVHVALVNTVYWPYWSDAKFGNYFRPQSAIAIFLNSLLKYYVPAVLASGLYLYAARIREEEVKASRLSQQLSESRLHLLRMQLHPHFLFNALHSISALVYKDPAAADTVITELSELLRQSLDTNERNTVPLQEELNYITKYLKIEKIRFSDRLNVTLEIEPDTLTCSVPNLILQPLVENSIKHGISRRREPGHVRVSARRTFDELVIAVEDDGPGLLGANRANGIGVNNVRLRLVQLYGLRARLTLSNLQPHGTLQELVIPIMEEGKQVTESGQLAPARVVA